MSTYFWKRHSHPWSGWTRFAAYPLLVLTMYTRQWVWLMVMMIFFVINPVLFPEPKSKNAWMTKVVFGRRDLDASGASWWVSYGR